MKKTICRLIIGTAFVGATSFTVLLASPAVAQQAEAASLASVASGDGAPGGAEDLSSAPQDGSATNTAAGTSSGDAQASADADSSGRIGDVVVTAQRRVENLQRVPISAQVIGQQAIVQQNITTVVSLAQQNPSIHVEATGRNTSYYIRGTGSGENQSFDQSVGTFIDDVYHGRSRGSSASFLDLDHIEVLKGPQTTFFGNNAIAGAFNIVTRKPGKELEGWGRALLSPASGENGGQYALEGAVTLPISEDLSFRVAGSLNGMAGYVRNVVTGKRAYRERNGAIRGTLRYAPDAGFDVTLKGEYSHSLRTPGLVGRQVACPPPAVFGPATGFCAINLANGDAYGLKSSNYAANAGGERRLDAYEGVLTVDYPVGDSTITSVTGYTGYKFNFDLDNDVTRQTLINVQAPERYHQVSQEVRLISPSGNKIEYLAGFYFQADKLNIRQSVNFFFLSPVIQGVPPFAALRPYLPLGQQIVAEQKERVYSAFASLGWNVTDQLKLVGALRGSVVTKDFGWNLAYGTATANFGGINPLPAALQPLASALGTGTAGTVALDRNDHALMPSARLQYQVNSDVMAYLSYNRGFKSGGFSVADVTANPASFPFEPEHVNAYEFGLKSEFADRRVLLNLAVFRNDFSDLQVAITTNSAAGTPVSFVRNAASSRSQGVELETQFVLSPMFRIVAAGTYLDSTYQSYPNAGATLLQQLAGQTSQDLSGHRTLFAPKWSGNVSGIVTVPVAGDYKLSAEATGIFSSAYQTYFSDDPYTVQPSYSRLDARISFDAPGGRWGFDIIGKNLTNTIIRTLSFYEATSFGSLIQDRVQLRNIAFQARLKF